MWSAFLQLVLGLRSVVLATEKSSGKICVEVFFPLTNLLMCDRFVNLVATKWE